MKKLISAVLCAAMLAGILSVAASAWDVISDDTFTLGDINADGNINAKDALYLKGYVSAAEGFEISIDAADINADGKANARDSLLLKSSLAKTVSLSDYESDSTVYKFTIGGVSIDNFCIVVPADANDDSNSVFAAESLRRYVQLATGYRLSICYGTGDKDHVINFNKVDSDSELGKKLDVENYQYTVRDGNLQIYGTMRGDMYAVFEILEDYLGYRYFSGEYIFLYKSRTVDIPEGTDVFVDPILDFRYCAQTFEIETAKEFYFPRRLNGKQIGAYDRENRYGSLTGPHFINAHSFLYYYTMAHGTFTDNDHLKDCYESGEAWVAEYNKNTRKPITNEMWQPCGTSDEEYNTLYLGMRRTMTYILNWNTFRCETGTSSISFSINDNTNYCNCRYCNRKAVVDGEGYSGVYLDMANRAARDVQTDYPGMKIYLILYDHTVPKTVRPDENIIIMYCGTGCNQHFIGSGECGTNTTVLGGSNTYDEYALPEWGKICRETGAELWFWYYPVTYAYYLIGCPNIVNIYYDYQYLVNECNCTGIYYEGGGRTYNFETLKAYMSAKMMWDPTMTYDEFTQIMKEYLYMYYGGGAEEIYQYIMMQDEAGNESGACFINNYDRPGEMYSYTYIAGHYEEMRALLVTALGKAATDAQKERIKTLIICCDFLGLSASYDTMYTNGTAASIATYKERYDNMYNRITSRNMDIFSNGLYVMPDTIDYSVNPMIQYYEYGSRRVSDTNCPWGTGLS